MAFEEGGLDVDLGFLIEGPDVESGAVRFAIVRIS